MAAAPAPAVDVDEDIELEWEEWDGKSPFLHHCLAGSVAGVAEHTLLFPIDTVKTHMQSYCADCPIPAAAAQKSAAASTTGGGGGGGGGSVPRACVRDVAGTGRAAAAAAGMESSASSAAALEATGLAATSGSSSSGPGMRAAQHMHNPSGSGGRPVQHGMLSTMRNLMAHGHSNAYLPPGQQPRVGHVSLAASPSSSGGTAAVAVENTIASELSAAGVGSRGFIRLWRGVQSVVYGCIPAHALYFSSYEAVKAVFLESAVEGTSHSNSVASSSDQSSSSSSSSAAAHPHVQNLGPLGSAAAGATAAFCHDLIMSPLDTVKQRLQLGHYDGTTSHAVREIIRHEGFAGLYRSFPITLLTNIPYGIVMVTVNESLREVLSSDPTRTADITTTMVAGCGAGMVAAGTTTPLDRVKTRLQTQRLGAAIALQMQEHTVTPMSAAASAPASGGAPSIKGNCPKARAERAMLSGQLTLPGPKYDGLADAFRSIVREEGWAGLFRGMTPRLLTHTPAVAISWTCYEAAKRWLATHMPVER